MWEALVVTNVGVRLDISGAVPKAFGLGRRDSLLMFPALKAIYDDLKSRFNGGSIAALLISVSVRRACDDVPVEGARLK